MRILLFDYSGHPFQVQLSRELAGRGHRVLHVFSASFQTPKGNLVRQRDDPASFELRGISTSKPFAKHSFLRRRRQEIELGQILSRIINEFGPDAVVSANAPLDVQRFALAAAHSRSASFVFWLQDIYSRAIANVLTKRLSIAGSLVGRLYGRLEYRLLRESDRVVAITDDFVPILTARGVASDRIQVIRNWAPLDAIEPTARDNPWALRVLGDGAALRIVYSGTIGYKHNPALLLKVAQHLPQANIFVFSEGPIAERLAADAAASGLSNFHLRHWVPFTRLGDLLGAADVVLALIEPEAGIYSVPSKVLTYLAAGRPIVASVPRENLAARTILEVGAGLVAEPGDDEAFLSSMVRLAADPALRARMARAGRDHALMTFAISPIGDRFEELLKASTSRGVAGGRE